MELTKEQVSTVVEDAETDADAILDLIRTVVPRWDSVDSVDGYIRAGRALCEHTMQCMIDRGDSRLALAWMNYGWSKDVSLEPWEIVLPPITYVCSAEPELSASEIAEIERLDNLPCVNSLEPRQ